MEYEIIRSRRRTVAVEITRDARVVVRAPMTMSAGRIEAFLREHEAWINERLPRAREWAREHPEPDEQTRLRLIAEARRVLPEKVQHYGRIMGLMPTGIRITGAKTRFGSCSAKNAICFSWRLMAYPEAAIDYVVVHELAHIRRKDHGKEFYALVGSVLPDYKERIKLLRR